MKASKIFIVVGVFASIVLSLFLNFKEHTIFPVKDLSQYEIGTYHEEMDSGWSEPKFVIQDEQIHFSYHLTDKRDEPFSAFYFRHINIDSYLVDVNNFDHLKLYLKSNNAQRIPITMRFRNDSLFKLSKSFPEILVGKVIEYEKEGVYEIDLKDFEIADWWLRHHGVEKDHIDLSKTTLLKYLAIGSCMALEPGSNDTIIIDQVILYKDNNWIYCAILLLWVILFSIELVTRKVQSKGKTIVVERLDIPENDSSAAHQALLIKQYIGQHYMNADLSMYHIQKELQLNANQIRSIFKDVMKDSFKNYLKVVRITEVKRLLKESDLTVSEIAYRCGFNDIPHFNRQFKSEVGITPKEFRKGAIS